ncbi:hypothetical protein MHU86_9784 [Fragilaria crotonensis]|nr:hypothetical protein MHU86_17491 [Fragilaria crotonensis]KAI2504674.1 hypothetical protein MHU86_9784 [Fragilaria crotonensis]
MSGRNTTAKEDIPIRGPAWTNAPILRTSAKTELREVKGLSALRQEFNGFFNQLKEGFAKEASATVDIAGASQSNTSVADEDMSVNHQSLGAFDFLQDLEKQK